MNSIIEHQISHPNGENLTVYEIPGPDPLSPVVMLLHGYGATAYSNWGTCLAALSTSFRVIALDHRGHGKGISTDKFHLADCADDAIIALKGLGIKQALLAGCSMGGPIALLAWRRHPEIVSGLVLVATSGSLTFIRNSPMFPLMLIYHTVFVILALLRPHWYVQKCISLVMERGNPDLDQKRLERDFSGHRPRTLIKALRSMTRFSADEWISQVDVPTAVIVTREDKSVAPDMQRKLAEKIAGATVIETPGDHIAPISHPDTFARDMVRACKSIL
jgi:pimeloyl-ACP methyl ester carboxylesterase